MAYVKRIVCLANSMKNRGRCIAGIEVRGKKKPGGWIRPVSTRETAELTWPEYRFEDRTSPRLLDVVELSLAEPAPRGHQCENHVIDKEKSWSKVDEIKFDDLKAQIANL